METVFDALKAMGKATSVELAARLDISRSHLPGISRLNAITCYLH